MNQKNNFALVRKSTNVTKKATFGAKRVLSSMAADALALAKPIFTVLIQDDEPASWSAEVVIKSYWKQKHTLRFIRFSSTTELLKLTREHSFDLIFLHVSVLADAGANAVKVLEQIKAKYGKPIIVTQGLDRRKLFEGTGVTFIQSPFSVGEFQDALKTNFSAQIKSK